MFDKFRRISVMMKKNSSPAIFEDGGNLSYAGMGTIVTGANGEAKKPIFIYEGVKAKPNGNHALIPIKMGDHVIYGDHVRGHNWNIAIYKIIRIEKGTETFAILELVNSCERDTWDKSLDAKLQEAISALQEGCRIYKNKEPIYVQK